MTLAGSLGVKLQRKRGLEVSAYSCLSVRYRESLRAGILAPNLHESPFARIVNDAVACGPLAPYRSTIES
jgi:hypothetical protein